MSKLPDNASAILQATLFAAGAPMHSSALAEALGCTEADVVTAIASLQELLLGSGLQVVNSEDGYELSIASSVRDAVARALKQSAASLSQSALEVLTIVAYHQPAAKSTIDEIRGVASDASLRALLARDLIVSTGMKGGAMHYRTTGHFLKSLGLRSIDELPTVKGKLV